MSRANCVAFPCRLLQALRNPGMRERHWNLLSEQLGTTLNPGKEFTLVKAEEMKLLDHLETITKVADVAGKEFSIEQVNGGGYM